MMENPEFVSLFWFDWAAEMQQVNRMPACISMSAAFPSGCFLSPSARDLLAFHLEYSIAQESGSGAVMLFCNNS